MFGTDIGGGVGATDPKAQGAQETSSPSQAGIDDFYRIHYESLVRLAFLLTLSEEVAQDLVQDVFVRVYGRFDGIDEPVSYIRRSVVNASRSWHRRRRLALSHSYDRSTDAALDPDELFDVLGQLPPRQRAAIVLRFYEQMTDAEIAAVLRCRPGTVASLVHRGCAHLRSVIVQPEERP